MLKILEILNGIMKIARCFCKIKNLWMRIYAEEYQNNKFCNY